MIKSTESRFPARTQMLVLLGTVTVLLSLSHALYMLGDQFGSGILCTWAPLCAGQAGLPIALAELGQSIRFGISALTWPMIALATGQAWRRSHRQHWILIPLAISLLLVGLQAGQALGLLPAGSRVFTDPLNLGLILILQALVMALAVTAGRFKRAQAAAGLLAFRAPFARITRNTSLIIFAALVSGQMIPASGVSGACRSWPICDGGLAALEAGSWAHLGHRLIVGLAAVQVAWLLIRAWKSQMAHITNLVGSTIVAALYLAQGMIGALQVVNGEALYLRSLHSVTAAAMWVVLVYLVIRGGQAIEDPAYATSAVNVHAVGMKARLRDFLALTKPVVVLLLLLTTYGGMVVGGRAWPGAGVTLATLVGGALAAGGSSAINQVIDRRRDRLMVRTARRPIAARRLTPAEGLAFGLALCLLAFYLLAGFVNLLAALLAVAGILYYVVLYSLLLKDATVQNIVIGGGAGAIPPLVGWAAVTGNLTLAGVMLFVVIFFWTPPHFWALALVRCKDYARAGVPMLPVVRGDRETRRQILIYTLVLVAITLLLPLTGLGQGRVYLGAAAILGLWLISSAVKVIRKSGNKVAWRMYRHSSMYLAFLFLALMIDAVI